MKYNKIVSRIKFKRGKQKKFLELVAKASALSWKEIAQECGLHTRTLYDWRKEKNHANYEVIEVLSRKYGVPLSQHERINHYWYVSRAASLGGKARYLQHGRLGTIEDRRKGGFVSQSRRRKDPEKYRRLGCNVRKAFKELVYSEDLAEVVGILLGDGSINTYQIRITLDRTTDRKYALFVYRLLKKVFVEQPTWAERESVIELTLSGASLVEMLELIGLKRGNKVVNQVCIPNWILKDRAYQKACLRGLFDTDGCLYKHTKRNRSYIGWTFTNHSLPLINGVSKILTNYGFKHSLRERRAVYVYKFNTIVQYMEKIGSHNLKHSSKLANYKKYKLEGCTEW